VYNTRMNDPKNNLPHCDHCDEPTSWLIEVEVPGTLREELLCEDCLDRDIEGPDDYHLQDEF